MVHLLALAALGGSVLIIDLRLLGVILKGESANKIGRDLGRVLHVSLTILIVSGVGLLSEEAMKCYFSPAFRWKMILLGASILFYFTIHRSALNSAGTITPGTTQRMIAVVSMLLWLGVGVAGRAIGLI
jgi:uncharacterized membrane protein SirB2